MASVARNALRRGFLAGLAVALGLCALGSAARVRQRLEAEKEVSQLGRAVRTALLASVSDPLTILFWATLFRSASAGHLAGTPLDGTAGLNLGVGLGSPSCPCLQRPMASLSGSVPRSRVWRSPLGEPAEGQRRSGGALLDPPGLHRRPRPGQIGEPLATHALWVCPVVAGHGVIKTSLGSPHAIAPC